MATGPTSSRLPHNPRLDRRSAHVSDRGWLHPAICGYWRNRDDCVRLSSQEQQCVRDSHSGTSLEADAHRSRRFARGDCAALAPGDMVTVRASLLTPATSADSALVGNVLRCGGSAAEVEIVTDAEAV